jgi:hypothetical protein
MKKKTPSSPVDQTNARASVATTGDGPARTVPAEGAGDSVHDKIALRAYTLWELAGHSPGDDKRYWFSAEHELQTSGLHPSRIQS